MENQMSQGLYDQIANNENGKIEDNTQLFSAKLYFYKLQKPYAIEKGQERYDNVVIGDTYKNVMLINDDDDCSIVLDGYIGQWEQSLEMSDRTFDTKEFSQKIKRQVVLDGDLEWTQDGTWIMSVNKPFTKDSKLDDFWVVSSMQREFGWRKGEPNYEGDEYYNPIRHDGGSILYLLQISEFNTLNGNALIVNWGHPLYLKEGDQEWNLKEILIKGNWNNTAFHSIELQGMNQLYGKITNSNLQVEKLPFLINPISLENISKFWSMWFSDKILPFGLVEKFVREESITGYGLEQLLTLGNQTDETLWNDEAEILDANVYFEIEHTSKKFQLNGGGTKTLSSPWSEPSFQIKPIEIFSNRETEAVEFYAHRGTGGSFAWRWYQNRYPEDRRNNWTYSVGGNETAFAWSYKLVPKFGSITIRDKNGNQHTFNSAALMNFDLKYHKNREEINIDFNKDDNKSVYFYRYKTSEMGPGGTPITKYNNTVNFCGNIIGWDDETHKLLLSLPKQKKVLIKGQNYTNNGRLIKLLKSLIQYSWYYKKGFPSALFSETGKPLNMSAKIKDKFANSNYAPNQVITNLIEDYKMQFPQDLKTEQWRNFMAILPMLGDYILCDYCVDGGLNDQHKAILPWYLELRSSLGRINKWTDSDGDGNDEILIDNDNQVITEEDVIEGTKSPISAWYKSDLDVYLRSEFFDFVRDENNNVSITNKFHNIDRQPNITVGTLQRTYPTFDSEMAESDISTIPYNMNLSDDYLRYMFNLFIPKDMKLQDFIGVIGAGQNYNANFTKSDYYGLTTFFEDETPNLSLQVMDNVVPTQFDLKGLFGNELEFEFIFRDETEIALTRHNYAEYEDKLELIKASLSNEDYFMVEPKEETEKAAANFDKKYYWNEEKQVFIADKDANGNDTVSFETLMKYVKKEWNDNRYANFYFVSGFKKSFSFTSKIFNDNDDRICRTSFLI